MFPFTVFLLFLSFLLIVLLYQTQKRLGELGHKNRNFSSLHKNFTNAVAGMEITLEREKTHSARMLNALENLPVGIALLDLQGRMQYANPALWNIYGVNFRDIGNFSGKSWLKLHSEKGQAQIREHVQPALEQHKVWHGETDLMRQDGVLIRAAMYISQNDDGYIGFVRDITEAAEARIEMDKMQNQMRQFQKTDAVERVLRALIHEFNNGLSSIIGFSEMLTEELPAKTSGWMYADRIQHTGRQMHGLIEQARLLLPSKNSGDDIQADILKIIPAVIGEVKRTLPLQFHLVQNIALTEAKVACDGFRLAQAIHHLLENAVEAGGDNAEISIMINKYTDNDLSLKADKAAWIQFHEKIDNKRVQLHYGFYDPSIEYIYLRIADKGAGIDFDIIDNILDPYFTSKKEKKRGSGLGMAIVRAMVREYKSYMHIDSIVDSGTVVTLLLPSAGASRDGFHATIATSPPLTQEAS